MPSAPRLHVTFNRSAAGSLRQALATLGLDEPVAAAIDELNLGPLEPGDAESRAAWFEDELGYELGYDEQPSVADSIETFWDAVTARVVAPLVWMSRRNAAELAGLHELVWRRGRGVAVVDVADVPFAEPMRRSSFAVVRDDQMIEHRLLDRAVPLTPAAVAAHRATWARLRDDGAALRVVGPDGLASAPITYFDDGIVACAPDDWHLGARTVGDAFGPMSAGDFCQAGAQFIWSRVRTLVEAGELEADGDDTGMRTCRIRRRPR